VTAPPRVAVVDPYSGGARLAAAFAARGRESVAVLSSREVPELFRRSFRAGDFADVVVAADDSAATASALRHRRVGHVIAGSEPGVELADELAERLALPTNGQPLRSARRDKFLMGEALRARGIETAAQVCSADLDELLAWARRRGSWPVMAKPLRSVASDGVAVCAGEAELVAAHGAIVGRRNLLGEINEAMLVEEHLAGTEYVVDSVSAGGEHRVAAFWRYRRPSSGDADVFYDTIELLPVAGALQDELWSYATDALDALQISHGPAHMELMYRPGRGPVLVEVGARLHAGHHAVLSRDCGGDCALDMAADACLDPDGFGRRGGPHPLRRLGSTCFLIAPRAHLVRRSSTFDAVRARPSFHSMSITADRRPRRRIAGFVTLVHANRRTLADDSRWLRKLERSSLYEPERVGGAAP
jgi:biotin carboxylase